MKLDRFTLKTAFQASLPVMAGYLVLGTGFGILLQEQGYSWIWAVLMSTTIYAGSMQYVAVDLLSAGASILSAALMTIMVNARHILYGLSMLARYKDAGRAKPYLIFALTDETYSLVCDPKLPDGADQRMYEIYLSIINQLYWIAGSLFGALLGEWITINTKGVDFTMTALFVVIFVEQWEKADNHLPALIGVGCAIVCRILFGAANFLIPTMIAMILLLFILKKPIERRRASHD